jgi:hypothetical protein
VAAEVALRLETHVVDLEYGLWCAMCALPSRWRARMVLTLRADPTRVVGRTTIGACTDCGPRSGV